MSGCQGCKPKNLSPPPSGRDLVKITIGLTIVCLISAALLGGLYSFTEPAKLRNGKAREAATLRALLEVPETGRIEEIRRYLTNDLRAVYLTPKFLIGLDENGIEKTREPVPEGLDEQKRDEWARARQPSRYVGRFFVGKQGEQVLGYVVEGVTTGYKAKVRFFVAMDGQMNLRGVEILEHEEDPGLGGEIVKRYFKNQFAGRSADEVQGIQVVKDPLVAEWKAALESLGPTPLSAWLPQHREELGRHKVIYAITGSTISSQAVTTGVQKTIANFRKRLELLKGAL
ncbi:MAG: FMN-binding protein [Oligoflexia bacterium]|nr:FMN-binding protein [Oligoflexia bacterium]